MDRGHEFTGLPGRAVEVTSMNDLLVRVEMMVQGMTVTAVEAVLVEQLRATGLFLSSAEVRSFAAGMVGPEGQQQDADFAEAMDALMRADAAAEAELVAHAQQITERLEHLLDRSWRVRQFSIGFHRTMDGLIFEVAIHPYSGRLARKVCRRPRETARRRPRSCPLADMRTAR